mmetsp:Transcript_254/g.725  ORF Transcript_254/g.725 Transcript_254/m.725 type:complete len:297 (+) Transcript_254:248-1138(+)
MRLVAALALGTAAALRPVAAPVVVGGGATAAALYGKLQRYEAVFDSGLARPSLVASEKEINAVDKVLWNAYCMASVTRGDAVPRDQFVRGRLRELSSPIFFVDATGAGPAPPAPPAFLPFFGGSDPAPTPAASSGEAPAAEILAACRGEHVFVLASAECARACEDALDDAGVERATVVAPSDGVALVCDGSWVSSRPQDLEGELLAPVEVGEEAGTGALDVQDLAEVAVQIALRLPRDASRSVRVRGGGAAASRQNANYFTEIGGKNAKAREGTVSSADWGSTLGALGEAVDDLTS